MRWQPSSTKEIYPTYLSQRKGYLYFHEYNYNKTVRQRKSGSEI